MVTVVTDSCASVPESLVADLGIEVVPYCVHTVDGTLRDGLDMTPDQFYAWLKTAPEWPTTAVPSAGEYLEAYRAAAKRSDGVVLVSITGAGSGGCQAAALARRLAEQELPGLPVEVVDTQQVALAHGWAVIQAARAALKGKSFDEVVQTARDVAKAAFVGFTNDTLEYLQRGGRIGKVTRVVGDMLSVKPIIGIRGGMPSPLSAARSRPMAYKRIVALAAGRIPAGSAVRVALMHVAAADEVEKFRPLLETQYSVVEWVVAQLAPSLGVHSGPGTVGIAVIPDTLSG